MSSSGEPGNDLSLERLGDGRRPPPPNEAAVVARILELAGAQRDFQAAYEALIDAVAVAALLARKNNAPHGTVPQDAIFPAETSQGRG
jgi:hypothetical protein